MSRPFQAIVAALALFVLAWFVVLHRPGSESSAGSSSSSSSAQPAGGQAVHPRHRVSHAAASTGHPKVAAKHVRATAVHPKSSVHSQAVTHPKVSARSRAVTPAKPVTHPKVRSTPHAPAMQAKVAAELHQGKVALLLFWNRHASDDSAVQREVQIVAHKFGRRVVVHTASADQVGSFGSITRDIQVYQTPTLLIVNPRGQVTTVTGYTDAYALEQMIREARG
ncbi:MAG TPA: hypothetical protein VGI76_10270 [Solirubrobacteraceae bacterium]